MLVRRPLLSPRAILGEESRGSVAITVSWMLTLFATSGALLLAAISFLLARWLQIPARPASVFTMLPGLMTVIAAVTGILCLVLTLAVYRVRRDSPPIAITVAAVFVSIVPLATILLLAMRG